MRVNNLKFLIVDDSDFSRKEISRMLESEDLKIVGEAANAKEATDILNERRVDIAIVDIVMPEISGLEFAEFVTENFSETVVILVSSLGQESILMDAISAGASDFIQKPINKDDLLHSIHKILKNITDAV